MVRKPKLQYSTHQRNFTLLEFQLTLDGSTELEVVEKFRLLGIIFQTNLGWQANTDFICQKEFARIWMLKRLKKFGRSFKKLVDIYCKQIRCILKQALFTLF